MNHLTKNTLLMTVILLCSISCSKEPATTADKPASANLKTVAQTSSSVVGYYKDTSPAVSTIPNTPLGSSVIKKVLYSIGPLTVQAGDVITTHLQQELTSTSTVHFMIGCLVVVANSPTSVNPDIGILNKASTSNSVPAKEGPAEIVTRNGSYRFASAASNVYINAVFYAASLGTQTIPAYVTVPSGPYGELVAVVEQGVTRYETNSYPYLPYSSSYSKYYAPATPVVHYTLGPYSIPAQTMVDIRYQVEGTSEQASNTSPTPRLGRGIVYAASSSATSGSEILQASQGGIPRYSEHHTTSSHAGGFSFSSAASNAYFNSYVYSKNVLAGDILKIEGTNYGHFVAEMRPYKGFWQDDTRNATSVTSTTGQVLYSVGPINVTNGDVYEVRYTGVFAPTALNAFTSKIIRATSATATTGTTVQSPLWRKFGPTYYYTNAIHSTAEKITSSANGQYYNVVVSVPSGGTLPVQDWGELEVIKR